MHENFRHTKHSLFTAPDQCTHAYITQREIETDRQTDRQTDRERLWTI